MSIEIIDTLKQKNGGNFPIAEAADIAVTSDKRLTTVLEEKADVTDIALKANVADVSETTDNLQEQIDQIVISSAAEAVVAPEVAQARTGTDSSVYNTLKERLDTEIGTLFQQNVYEIKPAYSTATWTSNDVRYTNTAYGEYVASGTASADSFYQLYRRDAEFPNNLGVGRTYYINFESSDSNLYAKVTFYNGDTVLSTATFTQGAEIVIPANTNGLDIRLCVDNTKTVDGTASFHILNAMPSKTLGGLIGKLDANSLVLRGNLANNGDLDSYDTAGQWVRPANLTVSHWPDGAATVGRLLTFSNRYTGNGGIAQIIIDYNNRVFTRYKTSAAWTAWQKLVIASDIGNIHDDIDSLSSDAFVLRGNIANDSDIDSYDTAGQWVRPANLTVSHWPDGAATVGRLLTLGDHATGQSGIAQIIVDYNNRLYTRYKTGSGWSSWVKVLSGSDADDIVNNAFDLRGSIPENSDIDSYDTAGQWVKGNVDATNWPSGASKVGRLLTFSNKTTGNAGIAQMVIDYNNNTYTRYKTGSGWVAWRQLNNEIQYITLKVGTGQAYTSVVEAIKYTMDHAPNEQKRYIIDIGIGTFDLSGCVSYVEGGTMDQRGLHIMPYTTIKGAGKDKTILQLYYTGSSDTIMTMISGLNAPYECEMSDFTLRVKNVRYAVHSDNALSSESSNVSNTKLSNTTIKCENCAFIHEGFDAGLTPSYKVPSAWGAGSWDNTTRIFKNCDFVSAIYSGLLVHDRVGLTKASRMIFENCKAINLGTDTPSDTVNGSSLTFISWGSDIKTNVTLDGCYLNKGIALRTLTNYESTAKTDYYIRTNYEELVCESTVNNSHKNDNFCLGGCQIGKASAAISAYTPVSSSTYGAVGSYNASSSIQGIALHDCASGSQLVYQTSGYIQLAKITQSTFNAGALIKYNGSAWVESDTNPSLKVLGSGVAKFI